DSHRRGLPRHHGRAGLVPLRIELYAQRLEPLTDSFAHRRRVLSNATGKHERIEPPERRRIRAKEPAYAITEHIHGVRRTRIGGLLVEQLPHVARALRYAEQTRARGHQLGDLIDRQSVRT